MAQAKKIINFLTLPLKITDNESNDMKPKRRLAPKKPAHLGKLLERRLLLAPGRS